MNGESAMRALPSVNEVLNALDDSEYRLPRPFILGIIRESIDDLRRQMKDGEYPGQPDSRSVLRHITSVVHSQCRTRSRGSMHTVINATGIVLHTGLGRAPLSQLARDALSETADGYTNLEFDLESGTRGQRNDHIEDLLCSLTGAESGLMVNNNAAAVLLCLNTLAAGGEAIISRGQLVEIGGSFRIPEVMEKSGAHMVEIGTTNRTHLRDYRNAITENTAMILIAHPSNYQIEGFVKMPELGSIVDLAHAHDLPVLFDLGSGALFNLGHYGLPHEPVVADMVDLGVDVITFSGDKLIGGPQSGLIVGKNRFLDPVKSNPMARALRCDKLIYTAMEATLRTYATAEALPEHNLTYTLLTRENTTLKEYGEVVLSSLNNEVIDRLDLQLEEAETEAGSGSLPTKTIPGFALVINTEIWSPDRIMEWLRNRELPIVGYIADDRCYFNLRTVFRAQLDELARGFYELAEAME